MKKKIETKPSLADQLIKSSAQQMRQVCQHADRVVSRIKEIANHPPEHVKLIKVTR